MNEDFRKGFDAATEMIFKILEIAKEKAFFSQHQKIIEIEELLEVEISKRCYGGFNLSIDDFYKITKDST